MSEVVSQSLRLVHPVITERAGVEQIYICVDEEEDTAVNAIILLECDYRVKALIVFVVEAVCWGVHNTLEVVAFCLGNVGFDSQSQVTRSVCRVVQSGTSVGLVQSGLAVYGHCGVGGRFSIGCGGAGRRCLGLPH